MRFGIARSLANRQRDKIVARVVEHRGWRPKPKGLGDFPLPVPFDGERCLPCGLYPRSWRSYDGGCVRCRSQKLTEQPADDET
jgi:hypothetical protein